MKTLTFLTCTLLILMFASPTFALIDDFNDGKDDGWTVIQGEWKVRDGKYCQDDMAWTTTATNETYQRSFFGDVNWSNYTVEVDLTITDPGDTAAIAGIFVRVTEKSAEGQYYFFRIDLRPANAPAAVEAPNMAFDGVNATAEGARNPDFVALEEAEVEYHLKVVAEGDNFLYYVDDELIMDITDEVDPFLKGAVGVGTFDCGASFDNFQVNGQGVPPNSVSKEGKLAVCWSALKAGKE